MRTFIAALAAALLMGGAATPAAHAQDAVRLTTPYPAVAVEAGEDVTFDLDVTAPSRQRVDLEVADLPAGWEAVLLGGGFTVDGVFASDEPDTAPEVELQVTVPPDADEGSYTATVVARGEDGEDQLDLTLRVAEVVAGGVTLEAEFPSLRGPADTTFSFDLVLTNRTPDDVTLGLTAAGPEGWVVHARPAAEQQAATATVEAGEEATIEVEVEPPDVVEAGTYPVVVQATGGGRSLDVELEVEITGRVELELTTPDERLNLSTGAGRPEDVALVVRNTGSAPLHGVEMEADPPADWEVTFEPEVVPDLPPGEDTRVVATVTPADNAIAGDYLVTVSASVPETTVEADLRATIEGSRVGAAVGVLLILLAVTGLGGVFHRFGRR